MRRTDELIALRDLGDAVATDELHRLSQRREWFQHHFWSQQLASVSLTQHQRNEFGRVLLAHILFGWIP